MRYKLPYARAGQVVGLLGGSFDPPHEGHAHITREALKRFKLDQVWWLVSPGNPLKRRGPAPMDQRLKAAQSLIDHPKVKITDLEKQLGSPFTAQTVQHLKRLYPDVHFVWLMGADNLAQFHQWQDWQTIVENVPIAVIARAGQRLGARRSVMARTYRQFRLTGAKTRLLSRHAAPAWAYQNVPLVNLSSTAIRASGKWNTKPPSK
ncbi:MAG: nicotinate-nucleotide adenylyltransferase [Paracoccaceae bacterium]|nr:nicotinate-nucleotide adenylyltransferase [Paracoccaceae bacterium]MDG1737321.1 nicotinate-nucleotide adenylyltransferase [Paracoccaceae bacterium]MDG2257749.1 nicotinate-nucleotide adenylyltransferase [Paracoccaceae bacterium]